MRKPVEIEAEIIAFVRSDPGLLDHVMSQLSVLALARQSPTFREGLRPILEEHRPELLDVIEPVQTTAKVVSNFPLDAIVIKDLKRAEP